MIYSKIMKYNKILLATLSYPGRLGNVSTLPTGLGYISESLTANNIGHDIIDLGLWQNKHEFKRLKAKIDEYQPDMLGISMMTMFYSGHYKLFAQIKEKFPNLTLVIGGPHISTIRKQVLEECPAIDFGVVLEGEETIVELIEGREPKEIKGLYFREGDSIEYTGDRPFTTDLDKVKWPKYEKYNFAHYDMTIPIVTSRGCPYNCTYCPVKNAIGRQFRYRSAKNVIEEIAYWYEKGIRNFHFWDDNFTMVHDRIFEICNLIKLNGWRDLSISVPNGVRADRVNYKMLAKMKSVGFDMLSFGVESASNKVLQNLRKGETIEVIEQGIKDACDLGYQVFLYFVIGSPGETWEDFEASLALATKYPVAEARFYTLIPFPATELMSWLKRDDTSGKFIRDPEDYLNNLPHFLADPCFITDEMSLDERVKAFKLGQKISQQQRLQFREKQFKKMGFAGKIMARTTLSRFYQSFFKPIWIRKFFIEPVKKRFFVK